MQVIITPKALRQYQHLSKPDQSKIRKRLLILEKNPQEGKKLSGKLLGIRSLKAWPYRIIYLIDRKQKQIFVITIAHRQGAYSK
ncbi:type II toxin-antitoxin system RelE/ParE family toxin [Candidatus Shapirobacteria bacterium]|nr:type II toxin-antitoxin system RelE/ParE family toxin [Candidatus Shapirobacteria bacterium]